jgi:hypothetical protein
MKKIIIAAAFALSTNAFAMDMPSNSDWAVAMTAQACNIELADLEGAVGTISKTKGGVIYTVTMNGEVVASASSRSTFILAKKNCL